MLHTMKKGVYITSVLQERVDLKKRTVGSPKCFKKKKKEKERGGFTIVRGFGYNQISEGPDLVFIFCAGTCPCLHLVAICRNATFQIHTEV